MMLILAALLIPIPGTPMVTPGCTPQRPAEQVAGRASRYDSVSTTVGTAHVTVCYGRPKMHGRAIFGGLVPFDTLWRTGANEPTTLHTDAPIEMAGLRLEAGSYALYTVPRAGSDWTLVVNGATDQWGHESTYPSVRDQEIGRRPVTAVKTGEPLEEFTIEAAPGALHLEWERTRVVVPLTAVR